MGADTKELAKISYVTDTDVSYYQIGDIEGSFQELELKDYIKRFGHEKLCSQLGYLQFQIWQAVREINAEKDGQCVENTGSNKLTVRGLNMDLGLSTLD